MLVLSARAHRAPTFNSLTISRRPARARKLVSDPLDHSGRISSPSNFGFIQKILQINATSKTLTNYSTYHFLQQIFQAERKVCFASWSKLSCARGGVSAFAHVRGARLALLSNKDLVRAFTQNRTVFDTI